MLLISRHMVSAKESGMAYLMYQSSGSAHYDVYLDGRLAGWVQLRSDGNWDVIYADRCQPGSAPGGTFDEALNQLRRTAQRAAALDAHNPHISDCPCQTCQQYRTRRPVSRRRRKGSY